MKFKRISKEIRKRRLFKIIEFPTNGKGMMEENTFQKTIMLVICDDGTIDVLDTKVS